MSWYSKCICSDLGLWCATGVCGDIRKDPWNVDYDVNRQIRNQEITVSNIEMFAQIYLYIPMLKYLIQS